MPVRIRGVVECAFLESAVGTALFGLSQHVKDNSVELFHGCIKRELVVKSKQDARFAGVHGSNHGSDHRLLLPIIEGGQLDRPANKDRVVIFKLEPKGRKGVTPVGEADAVNSNLVVCVLPDVVEDVVAVLLDHTNRCLAPDSLVKQKLTLAISSVKVSDACKSHGFDERVVR
eukprot:XP_001707538.1 Hypothetical protein GL50803_26287 [Giardia lamblia ATCC 50803]